MRQRLAEAATRVTTAWATKPWLHWAALYAIVLSYFFFYRLHTVGAILDVFAAADQITARVKASGMALGFLEDLAITTLLLFMLLALDVSGAGLYSLWVAKNLGPRGRVLRVATVASRFLVAFVLVALTMAPFAADLLLIRTREMRFTMDYIAMAIRERAEASSLQVDKREVRLAKETVAATVIIALFFAVLYAACVDLTKGLMKSSELPKPVVHPMGINAYKAASSSTSDRSSADARTSTDTPRDSHDKPTEPRTIDATGVDPSTDMATAVKPHSDKAKKKSKQKQWFAHRRLLVSLAMAVGFVVEVVVTCAITRATSPPVASVAVNMTLNELFRYALGVRFEPTGRKIAGSWSVRQYINSATEEFRLLKEDVLYRKTTGFKGPYEFTVDVDAKNPPNVLVLAVESFRYSDSLYIAGETGHGKLLKQHNLTVTPAFDRWAKRGVAFSNMWSSLQTSRSVESINFAQIPYDSPTMTGMTGGRVDTKLSGMPQLFKQKGYETVFTTGCTVKYDQWDSFLSSHGYDTVLGEPDIQALGMKDLHINATEWSEGRRSLNWGVHDDISFEVLGNLLLNKTKEQQARVAKGEPKKPLFLNHYTITSHGPFEMRPKWYDNYATPDFSPLYTGKPYTNVIKNYNELRYFTDMALGKFMDRMQENGVLNDTIVVIVGDHGQSPENGLSTWFNDQVAVTRVAAAIVAEGRLGRHVGLVVNDTTEHYDLLSTLADITGLPPDGFMQTGVGRSLLRKIPENERVVWSNNPLKKKSAVRGTKRFVYDTISEAVLLHDANADPLATEDLFPGLSSQEQSEWMALRDAGRSLNAYFKHRWDSKCLTQVAC